MSKNLIINYSRTGANYVNGRIVNLEKGNTEICAAYAREQPLAQVWQCMALTTQNLKKQRHNEQKIISLTKE